MFRSKLQGFTPIRLYSGKAIAKPYELSAVLSQRSVSRG